MSDDLEQANRGLEHAHAAAEGHAEHSDAGARKIAVLISVLAAALAIAEMAEKSAQNDFLTHHVAVSDDWAFYQAKTVRANLYALHADTLESLPNATDPAVRQRIAAARATAARLEDDEKTQGRKQLAAKARQETAARDAAFERYHHFETVGAGLQIAIVLGSVSVIVRQRALAIAAAVLGGAAALFGLAAAGGIL